MIDYKKVLEINKYVIENEATIEMVCKEFNISRRTAQAYCGKYLEQYVLESNDPEIKELQEKVKQVKKNNEKTTQFEKLDISLDEIIEYIIDFKSTIEYASLKFGVSESTINKYIAHLKELDNDLYKKYALSTKEKQEVGTIVGGKNSKRQATVTDFEALEIAEVMIASSMTLEQASKHFGIPTSTIYERIRSIDDSEIQKELNNLFYNNQRRI